MEWLFENPLLIIIILAAISSALKKGKSVEEKRQSSQPARERKPLQEPRSMAFPKQQPSNRSVRSETSKAEKQFSQKRKQIENRMAVLKEQELELAEKAERIKKVEHVQTERQERRATSKVAHSIQLDKESMVNGIILSEILGAPRAKKPHRSLHRR